MHHQEGQTGQEHLQLNGTHQVLVSAVGDNSMGESIHATQKNTENLLSGNSEIHLEVNAKKTKYMLMSGKQNAGKNHNIKKGT
jgi:hypothetical protein